MTKENKKLCTYKNCKNEVDNGFKRCHYHRTRHKILQDKKYKYATIDKKDFINCISCKKILVNNKNKIYCIECSNELKNNAKKKRQILKLTVMQHYSKNNIPFCNCCGENILEFLSIDHINNDGAKHRKELKNQVSGSNIYHWLITNNYPSGFQVLCMNCNFSKGLLKGKCAHSLQTSFQPFTFVA